MDVGKHPLTVLIGAGGGVLTLARRVCAQMSREGRGARIVILSPRAESLLELGREPGLEIVNAYDHWRWLHRAAPVLGIAVSTLVYVARHRPQRVFCWGKEIALFCRLGLGGRSAKIAVFSNSHTSDHLSSQRPWKKAALAKVYRWLFPQMVGFGAQTAIMADDLAENFGAPKERIRITGPFVLDSFYEGPLATGASHSTLAFVGRLSAEKNLGHLIEAFALVAKRIPAARLVIAGDGPLRGALEAAAAQKGLRDSVTFLGRVADPRQVYQKARVSVLCSHYEGFGLVVAEAMASGTPVVSYDLAGGPHDVIKDGVNGFLVEPQNVQQLAEKIVQAWDHPWNPAAIRQSVERFRFEKAWPFYREVLDLL